MHALKEGNDRVPPSPLLALDDETPAPSARARRVTYLGRQNVRNGRQLQIKREILHSYFDH